MKIIKLLTIIFGFALIFSSCGEDCEKTTFEEIIIGTWNTTDVSGANAEKVTFNSDGTGSATENSLFTAELNEVTANDFIWSYDDTTMDMNIKWEFSNIGSTNVDYEIKSFDCEEVTMNFILDVVISK